MADIYQVPHHGQALFEEHDTLSILRAHNAPVSSVTAPVLQLWKLCGLIVRWGAKT